MREIGLLILKNSGGTAYNSVFAIRFAHPNAFGTSQPRKTISKIRAAYGGRSARSFCLSGGGATPLDRLVSLTALANFAYPAAR